MRIVELGKTTGVEVETIRHYEKAGLLPIPQHPAWLRPFPVPAPLLP